MYRKIYYSIDSYKIFETANGRFVDEGYPLYQNFLAAGNVPTIEIDPAIADVIEIVNGAPVYKANYEATLLTKAKDAAKRNLAANRYNKEIGGLTISGANIHTDRESQALLSAAYSMAVSGQLDNGTTWKTKDGFVTLSKDEIIAISVTIKNHVEACFVAEKEKYVLIEAATTMAELQAVDLSI